jgi:hypothetical protein
LALIHGRGDRRYDLDGQPAGIVTPEERAEAARLLAASTQRGQAQAVRVREHQEREEQRRQQRERERRRREAKAARKAAYERQQQEIAAARSPWPCEGSWWNRAPSASAAWPEKQRPGPKASRAPGCPPSSCVVPRPRPPARRWTSRADAGSPRTRAGPAAAAGRISQQAPVRAAAER